MMDRKRKRTAKAKKDRISDLPDCMIHHILSFLPSTKEAIQTSILSKRWRNQWTHVPVLIFDHFSPNRFLEFIDNTLSRHDCSKIMKFHLEYPTRIKYDAKFDSRIRFATQKHVEELYLCSEKQELSLPEFLFNNASSLVKLIAIRSIFELDRKVNWGCLTALKLYDCKLTDQSLQHILSGSPLLESFGLINCVHHFVNFVINIASKSLKSLVIIVIADMNIIEISCPNLVDLHLSRDRVNDENLFAQAIENVLSTSTSLESVKLYIKDCSGVLDQLIIASKSLKKLFLEIDYNIHNLVISCPHLDELKLDGYLGLRTAKLLDLPSTLCATMGFYNDERNIDSIVRSSIKDILRQLHHVKELTLGNLFIKILSDLEEGDLFTFMLNIKSLTLNYPNLHHYSGIERLLRNSPELEKLVIDMPRCDQEKLESGDFGENLWSSDAVVSNCLVSHLKTIKITGFLCRNDERKLLMSFVQFLFKNAKVLEKMVGILKDKSTVGEVFSRKLLNLPRCSKYASVELLPHPE